MEQTYKIYTRILKDHMSQFLNKNVTIVGKYKGKMGNRLSLDTGENSVVLVENCDLPLDVNPGDTLYLEVRGMVKNANTLVMNELNEISEDEKERFDFDNYNKAIKFSVEQFGSLFN